MCRFGAWSVNFTSCFDTWVSETQGIRPLLKRKSRTPRAKTHVLTPSVSRTMAGTWQQQWREPLPPLFSPLFSSAAAAIVFQRRRHCSGQPPPLHSAVAAIVLRSRRQSKIPGFRFQTPDQTPDQTSDQTQERTSGQIPDQTPNA